MSFSRAQLLEYQRNASPATAAGIAAELARAGGGAVPAKAAAGVAKGGRKPREMNGLERDYAAHLAMRVRAGEVRWWGWETLRIRLAAGAWYKCDFVVVLADGTTEFHETKGFWREAARVRIKVAAATVPYRFVAACRTNGVWEFECFSEALDRLTSSSCR